MAQTTERKTSGDINKLYLCSVMDPKTTSFIGKVRVSSSHFFITVLPHHHFTFVNNQILQHHDNVPNLTPMSFSAMMEQGARLGEGAERVHE